MDFEMNANGNEDFMRQKRRLVPKQSDMTREQLLDFIRKKRKCEATALAIVVSLLDGAVPESEFINGLGLLQQSHYDDIVEERAIGKICGYPLCGKTLPDNLPAQQYKISLKSKKVYDITARKCYCSNECYNCSVYIKSQILTSPLWYRKKDDKPVFKVLTNCKSEDPLVGEEIDFSSATECVNKKSKVDGGFNSLLDFTEASLKEIAKEDIGLETVEVTSNETNFANNQGNVEGQQTNLENKQSSVENKQSSVENKQSSLENKRKNTKNKQKNAENKQKNAETKQKNAENKQKNAENKQKNAENKQKNVENIQKNVDNKQSCVENKKTNVENKQSSVEKDNSKLKNDHVCDVKVVKKNVDIKTAVKTNKKNMGIMGDVVERKASCKIDPILTAGESLQQKILDDEKAASAEKSKKASKKERARKREPQPLLAMVNHIEKCLSEWFTLDTMLFLFGETRVKQMVADKGEGIKEYLNNVTSGLLYKCNSYDQYQQLCRKLNLLELEDRKFDSKVNSQKDTRPLPHFSMLKEESKMLDIKVRAFYKGNMEIPVQKEKPINKEEYSKDDEDEGLLTNMPPVDKKSQNALRRKIVLMALNKVLPDLSQTLGLQTKDLNSDVRLLVATFNLQAHNITFKPAQWSLVAMIAIKLLSIRNPALAKALTEDKARRHLLLLMMSYEQDGGYLDRLAMWLTDVDRLLGCNDTQLTSKSNISLINH